MQCIQPLSQVGADDSPAFRADACVRAVMQGYKVAKVKLFSLSAVKQ